MKPLLAWLLGLIIAVAAPVAWAAPAPQLGPAWWKIDDGGGHVLWIMAIPDGMIIDFKWNDDSLVHRMDAARLLISPLVGITPFSQARGAPIDRSAISVSPGAAGGGGFGQQAWWYTIGGVDRFDSLAPITFDDPLSKRLPPPLAARLDASLPFLIGDARTALLNATPAQAALWLDLWNWPRGDFWDVSRLGNPMVYRAQALAQNRLLRIESVAVSALWKPMLIDDHLARPDMQVRWGPDEWVKAQRPNIRIEPTEALQQTCLAMVLSQIESGLMPQLRQAAMEAWARGDVENALKRSNNVQYCLMGSEKSTTAEDYVRNQAFIYTQSLDQAFDQPGQTVALVEFDPLLLKKGGVLDHYRHLGYEITTSNGMGD